MAFQSALTTRVYNRLLRPFAILQNYFQRFPSSSKEPTVCLDDAMENFTKDLLQKRIQSWEMKNDNYKMRKHSSHENICDVDILSMSKKELTDTFISTLQACNDSCIIQLARECIKYNICPAQEVILQVLSICAQKGELQLIQGFNSLCKDNDVSFSTNFDFSLYEAHAVWMRGNVIKALDLFEQLYINNPFMRRNIRLSMKKLISEEAKNSSEAILVHIVKFSENLAYQYKDYLIMLCVWEICFNSDWFSDQQIALDLLLNNRRLGEILIHRLPYIISLSLRRHRTEPVYSLLEILLKFAMEEQCVLVSMALLDYQFLQGNLRGYSEIIKWTLCQNISLPRIYNEKYLELLLNKSDQTKSMSTAESDKSSHKYLF